MPGFWLNHTKNNNQERIIKQQIIKKTLTFVYLGQIINVIKMFEQYPSPALKTQKLIVLQHYLPIYSHSV